MVLIRFESEKLLNSPEVLKALTINMLENDICNISNDQWINQRIIKISPCSNTIKIFNSWEKQQIVSLNNDLKVISRLEISTGESSISLPQDTQFLWIDKIRSPQAHGISEDKRRLGIKILSD